MIKHFKLKITGTVHGVGFRFTAMQEAYRIGVYGLVKNLADGSVYIEVEGEEDKVEAFIKWAKRGSYGSEIKDVFIEEGEFKNFKSFDILKSNLV